MKKSHKKGRRSKRQNKTRKGGMRKKEQETHEKKYISDIEAVSNMINCDGATLEVISIDSLYGFVFLLTIPQHADKDCIQFIGLDGKPIYQIILKVALCYIKQPSTSTTISGVIGHFIYEKSTMKWDDFYLESHKQTQIFKLFPSNPVTFGVACCHMYYRPETENDEYSGAYNENEKREVIVTNDENLIMTNALLSRLYDISTKPLDKETITYIQTILKNNLNYHLAFIAMDAAMNHIDKKDYDILTLRNVRGTYYYPRCIEYANAIMILLFIRKQMLNIDAHSGNFLSSVRKGNNPQGDASKIKSWMIDMGRIFHFGKQSICDKIYYTKYDPNLNGASLSDIYIERFRRYCEYDYAFAMWIVSNWDDLCNQKMINHENISNVLHFINTFIVLMDYSINLIKYHRDTRKPPQCMRIADHITETITTRFDSMEKMVTILNDYLGPNDLSTSFFTSEQDKYVDVLNKMKMKPMSIDIEKKYRNILDYMKMIDPTIGYHEQVAPAETNVVEMIVDTVESQTPSYNEQFSNPFDDKKREVLELVAPLRRSDRIAAKNYTKNAVKSIPKNKTNKPVKSSAAAIIGKNKVKK
jgi:hypothetical protein